MPDLRGEPQQRPGNGTALFTAELERSVIGAPGALLVAVAVTVPDEVQPGARTELYQVEGLDAGPAGDVEEAGNEHPASLDLVRLHAVAPNVLAEPVAVLLKHGCRVGPRVDPADEREVVERAEELERTVPALVLEHLTGCRLGGEPPTHVGVERRAALLTLFGLMKKDLLELGGGGQRSSAAFACSATFANAVGSLTASSASTLRSSSIPALRQPATNWL
jgi:hypothetical protein